MTFIITASGAAREAIERVVPQLVADGVAGRLVSGDATLWGEAAEAESAIRLGWVEAAAETDLHHSDIDGRSGEGQEGGCGEDLELGRRPQSSRHGIAGRQGGAQHVGEVVWRQQAATDDDPLAIVDQVRLRRLAHP